MMYAIGCDSSLHDNNPGRKGQHCLKSMLPWLLKQNMISDRGGQNEGKRQNMRIIKPEVIG